MKNLIITLLPLLVSLHNVETDTWKATSTTISFTIKHALGATAEGSFKGFEGNLIFNPDNLADASLKGTVVAKTIHTGISLRDNTLRGDEYFAVDKYPKISLVSTKIEKSAVGNQYTGYFNLTIKDITKNIKLPFTFTKNGTQARFKGSFMINRIDYGVGKKSALLNDTATISIVIQTQHI